MAAGRDQDAGEIFSRLDLMCISTDDRLTERVTVQALRLFIVKAKQNSPLLLFQIRDGKLQGTPAKATGPGIVFCQWRR